MIEIQTKQVLLPSFLRTLIRIYLTLFIYMGVCAIIQYWRTDRWWDEDYCLPLAIALTIAPIAVHFMFVPRRIEWSASEFFIRTWARTDTFSWERLQTYGEGRGVFVLKFSDAEPFGIYAGAFERAKWRALQQFIATSYPNKRK